MRVSRYNGKGGSQPPFVSWVLTGSPVTTWRYTLRARTVNPGWRTSTRIVCQRPSRYPRLGISEVARSLNSSAMLAVAGSRSRGSRNDLGAAAAVVGDFAQRHDIDAIVADPHSTAAAGSCAAAAWHRDWKRNPAAAPAGNRERRRGGRLRAAAMAFRRRRSRPGRRCRPFYTSASVSRIICRSSATRMRLFVSFPSDMTTSAFCGLPGLRHRHRLGHGVAYGGAPLGRTRERVFARLRSSVQSCISSGSALNRSMKNSSFSHREDWRGSDRSRRAPTTISRPPCCHWYRPPNRDSPGPARH